MVIPNINNCTSQSGTVLSHLTLVISVTFAISVEITRYGGYFNRNKANSTRGAIAVERNASADSGFESYFKKRNNFESSFAEKMFSYHAVLDLLKEYSAWQEKVQQEVQIEHTEVQHAKQMLNTFLMIEYSGSTSIKKKIDDAIAGLLEFLIGFLPPRISIDDLKNSIQHCFSIDEAINVISSKIFAAEFNQ